MHRRKPVLLAGRPPAEGVEDHRHQILVSFTTPIRAAEPSPGEILGGTVADLCAPAFVNGGEDGW